MMISESNMMADRDEDFNTRYGSYRGWQMAVSKVKPIKRDTINVSFADMVLNNGAINTEDAVNYLLNRFLSVSINEQKENVYRILE